MTITTHVEKGNSSLTAFLNGLLATSKVPHTVVQIFQESTKYFHASGYEPSERVSNVLCLVCDSAEQACTPEWSVSLARPLYVSTITTQVDGCAVLGEQGCVQQTLVFIRVHDLDLLWSSA